MDKVKDPRNMKVILPSCPVCKEKFTSQGKKTPFLLQCAHSICEMCIKMEGKNKSVKCRVCKEVTSLSSQRRNSTIPPDIYTLGFITAHKREADLQVPILKSDMWMPKARSQPDEVKAVPQETSVPKLMCDECAESGAEVRCCKCDVATCKACFQLIHKPKSLRNHEAEPISHSGKLSKCALHDRDLEFYCRTEPQAICYMCCLSGSHRDHDVISFIDANRETAEKLEKKSENLPLISSLLQNTIQKLENRKASLKSELKKNYTEIRSHFSHIHALLQLRESSMLKAVEEAYEARVEQHNLKVKSLQDAVENVQSVVRDVESTLSSKTQGLILAENGAHLQIDDRIKAIDSLPCVLKQTDQVPVVSVQLAEKACKVLEDLVSFDFKDCDVAELSTIHELEAEELEQLQLEVDSAVGAVQRDDDAESTTSDISSVTQSSASSHQSAVNGVKSSTENSEGMIVLRPGQSVQVVMAHLRNPGSFVVQRVIDAERLAKLQKNISQHCRKTGAAEMVTLPLHPGDLVLAQFRDDSQWYRARVKDFNPDSDDSFLVYYVDYGNTDNVPLNKLRVCPMRFASQPEFALRCCLDAIKPPNEELEWSESATDYLAEMVRGEILTCKTYKQSGGLWHVDLLSSSRADGLKDDAPLSLRDAIVFQELGVFTANHSKGTVDRQISQRSFLQRPLRSVGDEFEAVLTFVKAPDEIYLQEVSPESQYLAKQQEELQETYNSPRASSWNIYHPKTGMVCACHYEMDKCWYRAQVIAAGSRSRVTVRYVDFGNTEVVPTQNLRKLHDNFLVLTEQCIRVSLADIAPFEKDKNWSTSALQLLNSRLTNQLIKVTVKGVNATVCECDLNVSGMSIAQDLINHHIVAHASAPSENEEEVEAGEGESWFYRNMSAVEPLSDDVLQRCRYFREGDDGDRFIPPSQPLHVTYCEGPNKFYVQLNHAKPTLSMMRLELRRKWNSLRLLTSIEVGDQCVVILKQDGLPYRATVLECSESSLQVQLTDFGYSLTVAITDVRALPPQLAAYKKNCMCCHLASVKAAGSQDGSWTHSACTKFANFVGGVTCYIEKKGERTRSGSMPVELVVQRTVPATALTSETKHYVAASKYLVDSGLALPNDSTDSSVQNRTGPRPLFHRPAILPESTEFMGQVTHVDRNCVIYVQCIYKKEDGSLTDAPPWSDAEHGRIHRMEEMMQQRYKSTSADATLTSLIPGQLVAAHFSDGGWYRASVIKVLPDKDMVQVLYIDYGNTEEVKLEDIRCTPPVPTDDEQLCVPLKLHALEPAGSRKWQRTDEIYKILEADLCSFVIKKRREPPTPSTVTVTLYDGSLLADQLVELGIATQIPGEDEMTTPATNESTLSTSPITTMHAPSTKNTSSVPALAENGEADASEDSDVDNTHVSLGESALTPGSPHTREPETDCSVDTSQLTATATQPLTTSMPPTLPPSIQMPDVGITFRAQLKHVESWNEIYLNYMVNDETRDSFFLARFNEMLRYSGVEDALNAATDLPVPILAWWHRSVQPGTLCRAMFDDRWYRARVDEVISSDSQPQYSVQFLDFGTRAVCPQRAVTPLPDDVPYCPTLALPCALHPPCELDDDAMTQVVTSLANFIGSDTVLATVKRAATDCSRAVVELTSTREPNVNLAQLFLSKSLSEHHSPTQTHSLQMEGAEAAIKSSAGSSENLTTISSNQPTPTKQTPAADDDCGVEEARVMWSDYIDEDLD